MDFEAYSIRLSAASVCTSLTIKEAAERLNTDHPTGIKRSWVKSVEPAFRDGKLNGCQCPNHKTNRHWLFTC